MTKRQQILIISDTHGLVSPLTDIFEQHPNISTIIHCGDSELMNFDPILKNVHVVRGNCDYDRTLPNELLVKVGDHSIYVTHGHLYGVKTSLDKLHSKAKEMNADIAVYGHSHIAKANQVDDVLLVNPGSIAYPRGRKEKTYAIITLDDSKRTVDFYEATSHTLLTSVEQLMGV